eukprot:scaffold9_cov97-Isochrysis_galbana.AAC.3
MYQTTCPSRLRIGASARGAMGAVLTRQRQRWLPPPPQSPPGHGGAGGFLLVGQHPPFRPHT